MAYSSLGEAGKGLELTGTGFESGEEGLVGFVARVGLGLVEGRMVAGFE